MERAREGHQYLRAPMSSKRVKEQSFQRKQTREKTSGKTLGCKANVKECLEREMC